MNVYKALYDSVAHSEKLADLSDYAFRLWTCGLAVSDALGRVTVNPRVIHAKATPLSPYDEGKVLAALNEIKTQGLTHFYEVNGKHFMVYHDHDAHNRSSKNLPNIRPECPPPPQNLCTCVRYMKSEEEAVEVSPIGAPIEPPIGPPVGVPVPVLVSSPDDGPSSPIGMLLAKAKTQKLIGRKDTMRSYFDGWKARVGYTRTEQIILDPWSKGKTLIEIHDHFFPKNAEAQEDFRSKRDAFPKF